MNYKDKPSSVHLKRTGKSNHWYIPVSLGPPTVKKKYFPKLKTPIDCLNLKRASRMRTNNGHPCSLPHQRICEDDIVGAHFLLQFLNACSSFNFEDRL